MLWSHANIRFTDYLRCFDDASQEPVRLPKGACTVRTVRAPYGPGRTVRVWEHPYDHLHVARASTAR